MMKKYLLILLAAMALTACSDSMSDDIDYSTLSIEELVTTGDGVDYLVRTAGPVDEKEIMEVIADKALFINRNNVFFYENGWTQPVLYGAGWGYLLQLDDENLLECSYMMPEGCYEYTKKEHKGDVYAVVLYEVAESTDAKVVAYEEHVLVVEYTDIYGRLTRQVVQVQDVRDKIVNDYLAAFKE